MEGDLNARKPTKYILNGAAWELSLRVNNELHYFFPKKSRIISQVRYFSLFCTEYISLTFPWFLMAGQSGRTRKPENATCRT